MNKRYKNFIVTRERFIESIYHVVYIGNMSRLFNKTSTDIVSKNDVTVFEKHVIQFSMHWNLMLTTISLLDEVSGFLFKYKPAEKEFEAKIEKFKYIIEPALGAINKWSELRKFRNNVLAHNFRIDSEDFKSVHFSNKLHSYDAPKRRVDFAFLFKYIDVIAKITEDIFATEYLEGNAQVSFLKRPKKNVIETNLNDEVEKANVVILEISKRIDEYNAQLKCIHANPPQ